MTEHEMLDDELRDKAIGHLADARRHFTQKQEAEPVFEIGQSSTFEPCLSFSVIAKLVENYPIGTKFYTHPPKPAAQPQVPDELVCEWVFDEDGAVAWYGNCGACWQLEDGGPKENDMHYCPKCGGRLEVSAAKEEGK